ncbi:MAG: metalloregulator ArsR/SmtB family transcription factor [Phycisphaerales bacterium]
MVVQVSIQRPSTPKQAARCCGPVDDLLDPALFKALSDPTRAQLWACLVKCARPCSVSEVAECCEVDFSVVSRHLATLEGAGLLESRKDGRTVFYSVQHGTVCRLFRALARAVSDCCPASSSGKNTCCER